MDVQAQIRTLWRPVGLAELALMLELDLKAFPPRLPEQPIFYPVTNEKYAAEIARKWNTLDEASGYVGFVAKFDVQADYAATFEEHLVGSRHHTELWVPAAALPAFNSKILGQIEITNVYYGADYIGLAGVTNLKGHTARTQPKQLLAILSYSAMDFFGDTATNWRALFSSWPLWQLLSEDELDLSEADRDRVLDAISRRWSAEWPPLPKSAVAEVVRSPKDL